MPAHPSRTLAAVAAALLLAGHCARADDPPPGRAPADRPANRLAKETSPYLLQHARNPVDWYPWGPEAFERARREGKPIFLSVGYSSCYWCHVMERESFEDEAIARVLNANFVCVKVDREERPDVDAVYMAAVQAFQGSGGWPMTLFLFPDGRPFYGGTYFPPRAGVRPGSEGLTALLDRVQAAWRDHRADLERDADAVTERIRARQAAADSTARAPLSRLMARAAVAGLVPQYDPQAGGFGFDPDQPKRPKFPEPTNLLFLLDRHRRDPGAGALLVRTAPEGLGAASPAPLAMVENTLDHLARGGIRDQLGGGYHRYSVDRHWQVPHFEKMLYDNALLARAFLAAFETTQDERWKREAEAIFAFVARELTGPEGGFLSSLDAETDGDEGAYYVWTRADLDQALVGLEPAVIAAFRTTYGFDGPPNFEGGRFVLQRPSPEPAPAALAASEPARARLLGVRSQRPRPRLDDKVLTAWNGLMIAAYADGFRVLKNPAYREAAERAADFLGKTHRDADCRLLRTSRAGVARQPAYLDDHAFLAHGLLRLHAATGAASRLEQARALADRIMTDFADERGGFFDTASGAETLIARPKDPYDGALPSANAVAALVLVELGRATGEARYLDAAGRALAAQSPILARNPAGVPTLVLALEAYLDARPDAPETRPLAAAAGAAPPDEPVAGVPRQVVRVEAAVDGPVTPGAEFAVTVTLEVVDGWHLYANPPGAPNLKPTVLELDADQPGVTLVGVDYPAGVRKAPGGSPEPADLYEGRVTLTARLRLDPATAAGARAIGLRLRYQACDDRACLAPAVRPVPVRVTVGAP